MDKVRAKDHDSYGTLTLVSLIFPFAGIILGIIYLTKENRLDRKLGEHLFAVGIIASILWAVGWFVITGIKTPAIYNQTY